MQLWLAPKVRAARVETDIVFLDIASDAYLCLAGAAGDLHLSSGDRIELGAPQIAAELMEAGLVVSQARPGAPSVARGLIERPFRVTPAALFAAVRANAAAAKAIADLPFEQVLALAGPLDRAALEAPSPALLAESARFARMAPWLPRAGLCLMRSLQQRLYLARRGHGVAWVFGVRTWPFEAHCWLQAGDVVLDDVPARVAGFTPILVV